MGFARYPPALAQTAGARRVRAERVCAWAVAWLAGSLALGAAACVRHHPPVPASTATITGRVLGTDGTPLGGASVVLTGDPDDGRIPIATVKATAAGTFRIEQIPTGGYRLRARALGHVEGLARVEVTAPNGRSIDLKLVATVSLSGRIQDERGTAVPLARVLAFAVAEATSSVIRETQADEQGNFKLDGVAPGAHRLLIEAPGLGTASAGPIQAPDPAVVVVLPGEIRAIVGRVTRAGQPGGGVRLLLGGEAVPETRHLEADAAGRFAFAGLGPGAYALRAEAGGLVSDVVKLIVPERAPAQAHPMELALFPGNFLRGKVLGDDGRPLAGASVQIDLSPATGLWPSVTTNSDGDWTSPPLGPGTYRLRAKRAGFVARRTATVSVAHLGDSAAAANASAVTLEMMRTGQIAGRVVDEKGAAVVGAAVHDRLAETEELGVIWGRLPLAAEAAALPAGAPLASGLTKAPARRATTDATGHFVLGDVPPGRVQVEILNAASVPLRTQSVTLAPGARLDVGTLRVERAVQLTGRVLDIDDHPVTGARVSAVGGGATTDNGTGLYAVTGPDGSFTLPLSAGEHRLTAAVAGRADATATVRLTGAGSAAVPPVLLRFTGGGGALARGNLSIGGGVHDTAGRPLARARMSIHPADSEPPTGSFGANSDGNAVASAVADVGGNFRITGLPAARLTLDVSHDSYAPYRQAVDLSAPDAAEKALNIIVPVPGGIEGEVHERITGAPVPRFKIDARGPDGAQARFPAKGGGARKQEGGPLRFWLRRLAPGRWTLRVQASGFRPVEQTVDVVSAPSPGDPSVRDLRLELDRS